MEAGSDVAEGRWSRSDARRSESVAVAALAVRKWLVAAPFLRHERQAWLHSWIDPRLGFDFQVVPVPAHRLAGPRTSARSWLIHLRHAAKVWRRAREQPQPTGIITCFPHLAAALGLHKRLGGSGVPIVAWTFNLGGLNGGVSRSLSRFALASVDRFIVHSSAEIEPYRAWLGVPGDRLHFVPLHYSIQPIEFAEEADQPFVLALGSAHCDYGTFAHAIARLGYRCVVVAPPHARQGVDLPAQVEVRCGLDMRACNELVQRARVVFVPVANDTTASGQVPLLTAMMYGRPVIATRCAGAADYVRDGIDGLLVGRGDAQGMAARLKLLWESPDHRRALGANAREGIRRHHSDRAVAGALACVLASVHAGDTRPPPPNNGVDAPWRDTEPALHSLQ